MTDFDALRAQLTGSLLLPADDGFGSAVTGFNLAVVPAPDAVVVAADEADVVTAVRFARDNALPVRVHATGHQPTATVGGLLIAVGALDDVVVDPEARTATVGGGIRWAAVVAAAAEHGLAPITGSAATVGVAGYLLGGGFGPLVRSHGISSDRLRSARVVTGTGEVVAASADADAELLWALRGGKGGFGVVTRLTIELVPLRRLYAGTLFFDIAHAREVLGGWIRWGRDAPERISSSLAILRFPDLEQVPPPLRGRHLLGIRAAVPLGDDEPTAEAEALVAPLRALAPVHLDGVGELPAAEIARVHNDPTEPGPGWGLGIALHDLDDDFADAYLALMGAGTELPFIGGEFRLLGGAVTRDVTEGSAIGGRDVPYLLHLIGAPDPALFAEVLPAAGGAISAAVAAWTSPTTTINWVDDPTDVEAFESAWPAATREKLARIRAEHDPDGVFPYGPAA
jgi:FAD/FMN-containing dehydrogenase